MRSLSVFHSAAQALIRHEQAIEEKSADADFVQLQLERTLPKNDWVKAIISGADEHSPRWRHLLVLGGLLLGFGPPEKEGLSRSMRSTLETALVTAANLALAELVGEDDLGSHSITLVLNHCFPSLADHERAQLDFDILLPVLMRSVFHSTEGLRSAYFLGAIDFDVHANSRNQLQWPERSPSFQEVSTMLASPLLSSLGPLARLIGHSIEHVQQWWLVLAAIEDLEAFTKTLHVQWRQNKLAENDASEESTYLDKVTIEKTTPQLWKLLRSTLFAAVIILRSAIGRMLGDGALANDEAAPSLATQALRALRSLHFISSRAGSTSFSQYTFVYLTAMDTLASYPGQAEAFLQAIIPNGLGSVPHHSLDRSLDLFFLNTAEHFTLVLPTRTAEELLVAVASRYLTAGGNNNLLPIFEAAHSVMLAVFSAPQNAELTRRHLPFYIDTLFSVFPQNVTARQFRLAFKTLLRLTSPPSALAVAEPMLSATLLELLRERACNASTLALPRKSTDQNDDNDTQPPLSEPAVLTLTVTDTLPQLPLDLLDEWLSLAVEMVNAIDKNPTREHCKQHFWHTLVGGEMDPNRSGVCHDWWSTRGGREMLLFGKEEEYQQSFSMSGALPDESRENKL
ncbi:hypothetical protein LTR37_009839 [Vermiconidia calcicola]|uniref:Uncharacterized protein n=1 Tax=Vermiconidia calcicola TaxID=1690605 RepID=A0ACC3N6T1_9PEZI|nr:hypothetical protein LTR37_009839 [Vermiconidia calcicola]